MLTILSAPSPVLSKEAKPVKKITKDIQKLIKEMKNTLVNTTDPEGVGLAAPQIGYDLQLFIVKEDFDAPFSVFINPVLEFPKNKALKITGHAKRKTDKNGVKLEGCLSLPNIWGTVKRAPKVKITYLNEEGKLVTKEYSGFFATILQHEYDHLQGVLFPKRVLEQQGNLYKSVKNEKDEDIFEPIDLY